MCWGDLESFRTILKVSGQFRNLSGYSREGLDGLELCLYDLESFQMIWKVSGQSKECPDHPENVAASECKRGCGRTMYFKICG